MSKVAELDDFEMAAFSWIVTREWNNPLLTENLKVIVKIEDINNTYLAVLRIPYLLDWLMYLGGWMSRDHSCKVRMDPATCSIGVRIIRLVGYLVNTSWDLR